MQRVVHRFLCWFPLWAAGSVATFVGLAIGAAQVWPKVKTWDEGQRDFWVSAMTQPLFWVMAVLAIAGWGWLTWVTWPQKPKMASPPDPASTNEEEYFREVYAKRKAERFAEALMPRTSPTLGPSDAWLRQGIQDDLHRQSVERRAKWERERQPQRDVGLAEALAYAEFKEWGRSFFDAASSAKNEANEQLIRFRQLAHDGVLTVWGKRSESGVFQVMPKQHWIDHNVEWFDLLKGRPRTENVARTTPEPYSELMVCKAEFEREWPHA